MPPKKRQRKKADLLAAQLDKDAEAEAGAGGPLHNFFQKGPSRASTMNAAVPGMPVTEDAPEPTVSAAPKGRQTKKAKKTKPPARAAVEAKPAQPMESSAPTTAVKAEPTRPTESSAPTTAVTAEPTRPTESSAPTTAVKAEPTRPSAPTTTVKAEPQPTESSAPTAVKAEPQPTESSAPKRVLARPRFFVRLQRPSYVKQERKTCPPSMHAPLKAEGPVKVAPSMHASVKAEFPAKAAPSQAPCKVEPMVATIPKPSAAPFEQPAAVKYEIDRGIDRGRPSSAPAADADFGAYLFETAAESDGDESADTDSFCPVMRFLVQSCRRLPQHDGRRRLVQMTPHESRRHHRLNQMQVTPQEGLHRLHPVQVISVSTVLRTTRISSTILLAISPGHQRRSQSFGRVSLRI